MPNCFVSFQNCRMTIDEVACDIPHKLHHLSSYKHKNTLKELIGVAPNGVITFVSKLYPGSTSNKKIVSHCGILSLLEPGDRSYPKYNFMLSLINISTTIFDYITVFPCAMFFFTCVKQKISACSVSTYLRISFIRVWDNTVSLFIK